MADDNSLPPFFSIVIPVYNRFELVQDTIESVLDQKYRSFEIIIVDDGSSDGSGEKLDEQYRGNYRIRIIHQTNQERGAARNRGFRESQGVYVIFLDSDDRLLSDHLETLERKIISLGNPAFIATKFEFLTNGKRNVSSIGNYNEGYYDYRLFLDGNPLGCNVCVLKQNENIILFEEDRKFAIKEDWLFFLTNLRHQKLFIVDKVTLLMLDHEERSMRSNNELLISKTGLARDWIIRNVDLTENDIRKLDAHVNYFCAIHAYIEGLRSCALQFIFRAFGKGGMKLKYFVLLIKIIVGRKTILHLIHGS